MEPLNPIFINERVHFIDVMNDVVVHVVMLTKGTSIGYGSTLTLTDWSNKIKK